MLFEVAHDGRHGRFRSIEEILHEEIDKLEQVSRDGHGGDRHAVRLHGARQHHRRLPARQPDRAGGAPVDGQERAGHEHRRERRRRSTARPWPCSRSRCRRPSSRSVSSPPRPRSTATSCARDGSRASDWPKILKATESSPRAPLWIDDSSDIEHPRAAREGAPPPRPRRAGPGDRRLPAADARPRTRADSRVEQVGQISRGLKILARELEGAGDRGIAAVPCRRAAPPTSGRCCRTCARSGQIEQDADLVMFIYRDEYYNPDSERPAWPRSTSPSTATGPTGTSR